MNFKTLKQYTIPCNDNPGTLGKIATQLGKGGVNVTGISTASVNGNAFVSFTGEPTGKIEAALKAAGYNYFTTDILAVECSNKPGELGKVGQAFGENGVNIQNAWGYNEGQKTGWLLFTVNDFAKAKKTLQGLEAAVAA